ncbi:two-component system histidine kinase PnpS [Paenibacillus marinisediminis]
MTRLRTRLTTVFVVLIGISILLAGIYMAYSYKNTHIDQLEQYMEREVMVMEKTFPWQSFDSEQEEIQYYSNWAKELHESAGARITFVRDDGKVVGDSETAADQMDNHLNREEIKEASEGKIGSVIRYSDTLKRNMLYVAAPIKGTEHFKGYVRLAVSLESIEASVVHMWMYLGLTLAGLFVIAVFISYRIARSLTLPIENMTKVALRIAHMDYRARAQTTGTDEIGQLGSAINGMAESLQIQMSQIREKESRLRSVLEHMINAIVMISRQGEIVLLNSKAEQMLGIKGADWLGKQFTDVQLPLELSAMTKEVLEHLDFLHEELTVYYPEERILDVNIVPVSYSEEDEPGILLLLQDVTDIRRLERMRSQFVANVSHELKTPIAAVKGFTETLMNGAMNEPEVAKSFLQIIHDESERLNRLIGDILELSKIESKRVPLYFSPVHLPSFIEQTVEMISKQASVKHIDVRLQVEADLYVEADEDRLRQIILNLLTNAINYTPEGGKVRLSALPLHSSSAGGGEYDYVMIDIVDTGIGIPKKDLPRIFERFYRVDKGRSRSSGGTGLGLSIVKHLVESHHGIIRVESEVGVGTKFTIKLPVLQEHEHHS